MLNSLFPNAPYSFLTIATTVVGIMGALALIYAVLLEAEKRQDAVFVVGSASVFVYALMHSDYVVMFAMLGIFVVAGRELIQILRGRHHHEGGKAVTYQPPKLK